MIYFHELGKYMAFRFLRFLFKILSLIFTAVRNKVVSCLV